MILIIAMLEMPRGDGVTKTRSDLATVEVILFPFGISLLLNPYAGTHVTQGK